VTADPSMRSFLIIDVERSRTRDNVQRQTVRRDLYAVLDAALSDASIEPEQVTVEDRGDGALAVFDRPVLDILDDVISGLIRHLTRMNNEKHAPNWLRLRFAVHFGLVTQDPYGWSGAALDETFTLNGLPPVKAILHAAERAQSVLVVSDEVYRHVVCHKYRELDPTVYRQVEYYSQMGWAMVPGYPAPPQPPRPLNPSNHQILQELAALRTRAVDLATAETRAKTAYDTALDKITEPNLPPPVISAPALLNRIDTHERLMRAGRPPPAGQLGALDNELTKANKSARRLYELATGLVDQRDQLRTKLDCYHAMAGELKLELDEVNKWYREAHALLWTKPCELAAATRAVDAYQQSVIAERDKRR
jgi:hypothetical protein